VNRSVNWAESDLDALANLRFNLAISRQQRSIIGFFLS
jgi:hypothetical protein